MKKIYKSFFVIFVMLSFCVALQAEQFVPVGKALDSIPSDFKNDLWLNTHYREMTIGSTYHIIARRVPEIIDGPISNKVTLPPFYYTVVRGTSVEVNEKGVVTAKELGVSVLEVKYGEVITPKYTYGAVSPVNVTYMVVDVIDTTKDVGIKLETNISTRSYDTHYFTGSGTDYSFVVRAEGADSVKVKCNDVDAIVKDSVFTVELLNRANIIEVVAYKNSDTKKLYYVIDGRKIEINVKNMSHPGTVVEKGNTVHVSFKGITLPVYKLATIYNPQFKSSWGGDYARVYYDNAQLGGVKSNKNLTQYDLADNNTIELVFEKKGQYTFSKGRIHELWWGSKLGVEKDMTGPGQPNLNAPTNEGFFSFLPDFTINVGFEPATFDKNELEKESQLLADASSVPSGKSVTMDLTSGSFGFKNIATNWGQVTSWHGVALSNRTDNTTEGGLENQFNSGAGGDVNGTGNYTVIFGAGMKGMGIGPEATAAFVNKDFPKGQVISGCYVTNNTYAITSMKNGDDFSKKFGGASGNDPDYFKLTAKGYDEKGEVTDSVDFYLADFRFEENKKDYIVEGWRWFDLSSLGSVSKVIFELISTDVGVYGMNTPAYFCLDNLGKPRLRLNKNLQDVEVDMNSDPFVIALDSVFLDSENTDIEKLVSFNTNSELVTTKLEDNRLILSFASGKFGKSEISIKGKSGRMEAETTFKVSVIGGTGPTNTDSLEDLELSVFPIPFDNELTIKGRNLNGKIFRIYDLNGHMVRAGLLNSSTSNTIDNLEMASGIYVLVVYAEQGIITKKIVKY